jgi:hypothetical protein
MTDTNDNERPTTNTLGDGVMGRVDVSEGLSLDGYTTYTVWDLLHAPKPRTNWFWGDGSVGVFPADSLAAVAGYTSEGKTTLAFHLAAAAVDGRRFLGHPVSQIDRALVVTETDEVQTRELFEASKLSSRGQTAITICPSQPTAFDLEVLVSELRPELLVLDSLTSIAPGLGLHDGRTFDWNAPSQVTTIVLWLRWLRKQYHISLVLPLVHSVKPPRDKEGKRLRPTPTAADVRGSGAVLEQMDTSFVIVPTNGETCGYLARVKRRRAGTVERVDFKYDAERGVFLPTELTDDAVLEAVQAGHTSREAIARHLHFRADDVRQTVNRLVGEKRLCEPANGKLALPILLDTGEARA